MCLIVDDDILACEIAAEALISWGFKVTVKHDGMDALTWCSRGMPDFILLDMKMPNIDGFSFMRMLNKITSVKHPIVIASTGLHDAETVKRLMEYGISAYLVKPYGMNELKKRLIKLGLYSIVQPD